MAGEGRAEEDEDALWRAIDERDWERAKGIGGGVNRRSPLSGMTPLMLCAREGGPEALELADRLLGRGARLWEQDDFKADALGVAIRGGEEAIALRLIRAAEEGAALWPWSPTLALSTALSYLGRGRGVGASVVWALLEAGADPDDRSCSRWTIREMMMARGEGPAASADWGALNAFEERGALGKGPEGGASPEAPRRPGPRI